MDKVYYVCEGLVAFTAVAGNGLVLYAFCKERRLRRRTNYYIVSLAVADLLVGLLGIPCALFAYVGWPKQLHACLFTLSLLVVLCTISIFSLVAVSVDRYWAILYPMGYSRNVRTKTAICIICGCWVAGTIVGFLPLFGWNKAVLKNGELEACAFTRIMDYNFLVFIYLGTIIFPGVLMAAFYAHIYTVVVKQLRQMVTVNGTTGGSGAMLRVLGAARKREVKATQNLSVIVLFFMICWFPLYTINFIKAFRPDFPIPVVLNDIFIILTHLNSAGNPVLYAYHLRDFRAALRALLIGSPETKTKAGKDNSAFLQENDNINDKIKNKQIQIKTKEYNSSIIALNKNKQVFKIITSDRFELTPKTPHRIFNLSIDSSMDIIKNDKEYKINKKLQAIKDGKLNYTVLDESESHTDEHHEANVEKIVNKSESPLEYMDDPTPRDINNEVYSLGVQPVSPVRNDNDNNNILKIFKCNCIQNNLESNVEPDSVVENTISLSLFKQQQQQKESENLKFGSENIEFDSDDEKQNLKPNLIMKCLCTMSKDVIKKEDQSKEKSMNVTEDQVSEINVLSVTNISLPSTNNENLIGDNDKIIKQNKMQNIVTENDNFTSLKSVATSSETISLSPSIIGGDSYEMLGVPEETLDCDIEIRKGKYETYKYPYNCSPKKIINYKKDRKFKVLDKRNEEMKFGRLPNEVNKLYNTTKLTEDIEHNKNKIKSRIDKTKLEITPNTSSDNCEELSKSSLTADTSLRKTKKNIETKDENDLLQEINAITSAGEGEIIIKTNSKNQDSIDGETNKINDVASYHNSIKTNQNEEDISLLIHKDSPTNSTSDKNCDICNSDNSDKRTKDVRNTFNCYANSDFCSCSFRESKNVSEQLELRTRSNFITCHPAEKQIDISNKNPNDNSDFCDGDIPELVVRTLDSSNTRNVPNHSDFSNGIQSTKSNEFRDDNNIMNATTSKFSC